MKLQLTLLAGAALLAACNKPAETPTAPPTETAVVAPAPEAAAPVVAQAAPSDPALVARLAAERVAYVCDNEETVELRIFPDQGVAALWRGGQSTELHQVKAYPPTFRYEAGPVASVEGTPDAFTMQVGAMALTQCTVKK